MIENINDPAFDEIAEAKKQGHKFHKIYLHRSKAGKGQQKISISGAIILRGYRSGIDQDETFTFQPMSNENLDFYWDRNEREFICWLYEDQGPGYFSNKCYNKDLLATHFDQDYFIIKEPELFAEVKTRYEWLKKNPPKLDKPVNNFNPHNNRISKEDDISDLESQIQILQGRKKQIQKLDVNEKEEAAKISALYEKEQSEKNVEEPVIQKTTTTSQRPPQKLTPRKSKPKKEIVNA